MLKLAMIVVLVGVSVMTAEPPEKKDPPPKKKAELKAPFTDFVTYKRWIAHQKMFINDATIQAYRKTDKKGKEYFALGAGGEIAGGVPPKGSQLVYKDGTVYVIDEAFGPFVKEEYRCYATKQAKK